MQRSAVFYFVGLLLLAAAGLLLAHYRACAKAATYCAVDAILLALIANDVRRQLRPRVYPAMLAVFVATQLPTFFLYRTRAWRSIVESFAALPLP